jgi:MOSC domain-containing protein YiiM
MQTSGSVVAVCKKAQPGIPKIEVEQIHLIKNIGVEGDYHAGELIRHRYLAKKEPTRKNNRQVLIIDTTILGYLSGQGIELKPGWMGENIILDGISVMTIPLGTHLKVGEATLEINEIRNPCYQLDEMHAGVHEAVKKSGPGTDRHNAGMLARVLQGGLVQPGDSALINS